MKNNIEIGTKVYRPQVSIHGNEETKTLDIQKNVVMFECKKIELVEEGTIYCFYGDGIMVRVADKTGKIKLAIEGSFTSLARFNEYLKEYLMFLDKDEALAHCSYLVLSEIERKLEDLEEERDLEIQYRTDYVNESQEKENKLVFNIGFLQNLKEKL